MPYKNHVISTNNERLTSGFRTPSRPDHNGTDFTDADRLELTQDVYILAFEDGLVLSPSLCFVAESYGQYGQAIILMLYTGVRSAEALGLKWND